MLYQVGHHIVRKHRRHIIDVSEVDCDVGIIHPGRREPSVLGNYPELVDIPATGLNNEWTRKSCFLPSRLYFKVQSNTEEYC